jgi:hypothetical protein
MRVSLYFYRIKPDDINANTTGQNFGSKSTEKYTVPPYERIMVLIMRNVVRCFEPEPTVKVWRQDVFHKTVIEKMQTSFIINDYWHISQNNV